eukprot:COSAG02_NODE_23323_length_722_cov_1.155698_1_plen_21_part_10
MDPVKYCEAIAESHRERIEDI